MAPIGVRPISPDQQLANFLANFDSTSLLVDAAKYARTPNHPDRLWATACRAVFAIRSTFAGKK